MGGQATDFDHRKLTPEQWDALKRLAAREAQAVRADAVRQLFRVAPLALRTARTLGATLSATAGRWWARYIRWRKCRAAVRELAALDDRTLKDLGLHRSEIETVVWGQETRVPFEDIAQPRQREDGPRPPCKHRTAASALEKDAA